MTQITPKIIKTWEDIRNNPEHWNQKFSLLEFKDPQGKIYWTKDYNFIPHWKRYKQAQEWIKNTKFPEYNCKIGWNANNEILLVTQNYFGSQRWNKERSQEILNKIRKKLHHEINNTEEKTYQQELREGLKLTTYEEFYNFPYGGLFHEELNQLKSLGKSKEGSNKSLDLSRNDIVILWKKQLYFIASFTYTNNYKLTVEIRARKCQLMLNYYNWTSSQGVGIVNQAPNLIKDTNEKNPIEGHRLHYDFCGDLGIKRIEQQAFTSYQPSFQLFRAKYETYTGITGKRVLTWSEQSAVKGGEPKQLSIPTDLSLSKFDAGSMKDLSSSWNSYVSLIAAMSMIKIPIFGDAMLPMLIRRLAQTLMDTKIFLVIAPTEMDPSKGAYFSEMKNYEEVLFPKSPTFTKWLKNQPHCWDHTTFQFYLFNKITMTANGRYLGIKEKDGQFVLPYKLFINYSPGNLYYRWEFAYITVKCELSHQGTFEDWTNPARTLRNFSTNIKGSVGAFGFKAGGATGGGFGWADNSERAGDMKDKDDPKPEEEAQTERMFKNTFRNFQDKSIEPSQFNSNTIDFHYSLGEFFNRLTDPIFFYRCEISELLYNRLNWANNKSTPLNLPLSWKELGSWTQKQGLWKWSNVYLEKDVGNFWTNIMQRGYFLDEGEKLTNPKLAFAHASNHIGIGGNAWNISQAEEEVIEKVEIIEKDEKVASGDAGDREWSHGTWIKPTNPAEMSNFLSLGSPFCHPGPKGFCWGCSGNVGSPGTYTPNQDTEIEFILEKSNKGNRQIASCKAGVSYQVRVEKVGNELQIFFKSREERITHEVKIKDPVKTVEQEIDETELENEVEEEQEEEVEGENEEEMEKDLGADKEIDLELEEEKEEEAEQEQEQEAEQEQETEKENEQEKEEEKEKEKEPEKEEEKEKKEDEWENEDEGETEL